MTARLHASEEDNISDQNTAYTARHVLSIGGKFLRLQREDVKAEQGRNSLRVTQLMPAQRESAALLLMILTDDTLNPLNPSVGNRPNDVKEFIIAQPLSVVIGVG